MKLKIDFGFGIVWKGNGHALLDHEQRAGINTICHRAFSLFGGYTRYNTVGAWLDPDTNQLVTEAGCTVSVLVEDEWDLIRDIELMVEQIKNSLQQKAVAVTRTEVLFDNL